MCKTCQVVTQANFSCGHQLTLSRENNPFCLFHPHTKEEFHMHTTVFEGYQRNSTCYECHLRKLAINNGMKGQQRHEWVRERYATSRELNSKTKARDATAAAKKSQQIALDADKIAELNRNAKAQVKYYLGLTGRRALNAYGKANFLKMILQVPDVLDKKALVTVFGSYAVWDQKDNRWKGILSEERSMLTGIARKAGVLRVLEDGLSMQQQPVVVEPAMKKVVKEQVAKGKPEEKAQEKKAEEEKPAERKPTYAQVAVTKK